jgi:hypothetical protein
MKIENGRTMKYLSIILVPFAVGIVVPLVFGAIQKSNLKKESKMRSNDFIVCLPMIFCWFAIFSVIIIMGIAIPLIIFNMTNLAVICISPIMVVVCIVATHVILREKIIVKGEVIYYTPIFSKKRTYTFDEIKEVSIKREPTNGSIISYKVISMQDKKMFFIPNMSIGVNLFLERVKQARIKME